MSKKKQTKKMKKQLKKMGKKKGENKYSEFEKPKIFLIALLISVFLCMSLSSAVVSFYQDTSLPLTNNHTSRNYQYLCWVDGAYKLGLFQIVRDVIDANNKLEVEIDYSMYAKSWNEANPQAYVTNCSFVVNYFPAEQNQSSVVYEEIVNATEDAYDKKYFIRMSPKDCYYVIQECYFANSSSRNVINPTELQAKLPTYECRSCQYFEWSMMQRQVQKARTIGDNVVGIWGFTTGVIKLNYEIILALFWFLMLLLLLFVISMIFIGIYYVYLWLNNVSRKLR